MGSSHQSLSLAEGLERAGITQLDLWGRYLAIGGNGDFERVRGHLAAEHCPDEHEHNVLAQVLNDVFVDRGEDHPVAYRHLKAPPDVWSQPGP